MICTICNSEDVKRAGTELELFECSGCDNYLDPQEVTETAIISNENATRIRDAYFKSFPNLKQYMHK